MQQQHSVSLTLSNPTAGQLAAINDILSTVEGSTNTEVTPTRRTRGRPAKTVSEEESESFGTKTLTARDLEEINEEINADIEAEELDESEEEEESGVTFDQVKAVINKYGEKKPDEMRAILAGFNVKSTKQLADLPAKWEPVYNKVQAKLTAQKKKK